MANKKLELLAPARTADIGIEAIRHGADAVYIGAPKFGARATAGNSVDDIARLCQFAHQFGAKVYVTINTILRDDELPAVERLIHELYAVHVDALIVQDMALARLNLPPIPLHASTQMDNSTPEKVCNLYRMGFRQAVLARELTIDDIAAIHAACPDMTLEVFVHGALCVSMSGHCYASECLFSRSANRGECAQVCRMEFDLVEERPHQEPVTLLRQKHLLSLKDLCHINSLQRLIDAGPTSFKIEGRLKDMAYVKNVTAAYSEALDQIVRSNPSKYERASHGRVELKFQPDVSKSFNRGFTSYFLYGRNNRIASFDTPKSLGEEVGTVKEIQRNSFSVAGIKSFSNGDGLCFIDQKGRLFGFRVNKVENGRLFPLEMPRGLQPKMRLYRNYDKRFDDLLSRDSAERYIPVDIAIDETSDGFQLTMTEDSGATASISVNCQKELARSHQSENILRQLSKLGDTIFRLRNLDIRYKKNWFIPSSQLAAWRRELAEKMAEETMRVYSASASPSSTASTSSTPQTSSTSPASNSSSSSIHPIELQGIDSLDYSANVFNSVARSFYSDCGVQEIAPAYELTHPADVPVMYCKHCIKFALGWCAKQTAARHDSTNYVARHNSNLYLTMANGTRFRLEFDCRQCMMKLYKA